MTTMAKISTNIIESIIDEYEEGGVFHNEEVKAKRARKQLALLKKRISDLEHEIKHFLGDCDCGKSVDH